MRTFSRIVIINFIVAFIVAAFFPHSYSSKTGNEMQMIDVVMFIWGFFTILATFVWIGYVFYHWGTNQFQNKSTKVIWFWVILVGAIVFLIGPIVYHLVVVELGRGVIKKRGSER